jgi:hypothetical protein
MTSQEANDLLTAIVFLWAVCWVIRVIIRQMK